MSRPLAATLLLAGLALVPAASADAPVSAEPGLGLVECRPTSFDAQGDGNAERWTSCSTPPCGCDCPYAGAGVVVEAAGSQVGAAAVTSGCQTAYATTNGPADGGEEPVTAWPIVGLGGLDVEMD